MSTRYTIIAPHIDDEMIGCWSLLRKKVVDSVIYLNEITPERRAEAERAAKNFGFTPHFITDAGHELDREALKKTRFVAPNYRDQHPDHKVANTWARIIAKDLGVELCFYSVDMNHYRETLSPEQSNQKRKDLMYFYPSQVDLFRSDARYYLFEGIVMKETTVTITVRRENIAITTPSPMAATVHGWLIGLEDMERYVNPTEIIDELVATFAVPHVKVEITTKDNITMTSEYGTI